MKKKIYAVVGVSVLLLLVCLAFIPSTAENNYGDSIDYKGTVCIYKNGELIECNHNILYNSGKNLIRDLVGGGGSGAVLNISLCNATAGCGGPVADASETYSEFAGCGLENSQGTYTALTQDGNWTITKTFTATCDNVETNVTRLQNATGTNFAGNSFTLVTLQTNDQLTINWTIQVS